MNVETPELEAARQEIIDSDGTVRNAEKAISEYLLIHPNSHAAFRRGNRFTVRLDAMTADPQLTALERQRDEAQLRFAHALEKHAELKSRFHEEARYVGGHR